MLNHDPIIALALAREHARDLEREADQRRLLDPIRGSAGPARRGGARMLLARPVRAISNASQSIADAACTAAVRLEGRSA